MRALCLIRPQTVYRRECFIAGLEAAGYKVVPSLPEPKQEDVLVIWNRYGQSDETAKIFERRGARVVVCENGYLGKDWLGDTWIAMALGHHCGAGKWVVGDDKRWDELGVVMLPYRNNGKEVIILAQRGIGELGVASPPHWAENVRATLGGRIRPHPGNDDPRVPLEQDLRNASYVVTWHSSAALKALMLGIPVRYDFAKWIGGCAGTRLDNSGQLNRSVEDRLAMFRRLIWAQWRLSEIASGKAFEFLLETQTEVA